MQLTAGACVGRPLTDSVNKPEQWAVFAVGGILARYGVAGTKTLKPAFTISQTGSTATAASPVFDYAMVGKTILYSTVEGNSCRIVDYISPTQVTVEPAQTIPAVKFQIIPEAYHRFGLPYASELHSGEIDFGVNSRAKHLNSWSPQLSRFYYSPKDTAAGSATIVFDSLIVGQWLPLGHVNVLSASAVMRSGLKITTYIPLVNGVDYKLNLQLGLIWIMPSPTVTSLLNSVTVTFNYGAITSSFTASIWGCSTVGTPLQMLGQKVLPAPDTNAVIKAHFLQYLFQDRIIVSGTHNPVHLALRRYEIFAMEGDQAGLTTG
jgi:hypothetical protein